MHALARTAPAPALPARDAGCDPVAPYGGLGVAHELPAAAVAAGRAPAPGPALDALVAAHAEAQHARDSGEFRRRPRTVLARTTDRVVDRYWQLAAAVAPAAPPTTGEAHDWLCAALRTGSEGAAPRVKNG
ncbi:hypothetical protein [Streptomyces sp. NPDC050264]|uniref:hypothetical protein n=1 Tax=Streptomyces sp. NPDC050264 TaxID=3155038 RepID=UPI00343E3901